MDLVRMINFDGKTAIHKTTGQQYHIVRVDGVDFLIDPRPEGDKSVYTFGTKHGNEGNLTVGDVTCTQSWNEIRIVYEEQQRTRENSQEHQYAAAKKQN